MKCCSIYSHHIFFDAGTVASNGPSAPNSFNHVDNKMGEVIFCHIRFVFIILCSFSFPEKSAHFMKSRPMFPLFSFNSTKLQNSWHTPAWTTGSTVGPLPISTPRLSEHLGLPWCHGSNAPYDAGHHAALQSGTSAIPAGEEETGQALTDDIVLWLF